MLIPFNKIVPINVFVSTPKNNKKNKQHNILTMQSILLLNFNFFIFINPSLSIYNIIIHPIFIIVNTFFKSFLKSFQKIDN